MNIYGVFNNYLFKKSGRQCARQIVIGFSKIKTLLNQRLIGFPLLKCPVFELY